MKYMKNTKFDVAVIGGGAAGLLASGIISHSGLKVALLEKNNVVGRKLSITGKGRCNITNNTSPQEVIRNTTTNGKFLYSSIFGFTPEDTMSFFQSLGIALKTERGRRVFPVSDRAYDVVDALRRYAVSGGVNIYNATASHIATSNGAVSAVQTGSGEFKADNVILCTGGMSYPGTGSTGDGYKMAAELGHTVATPKPSLVPLEENGDICRRMQGLSLKNVCMTVFDKNHRRVYQEQGEMMFTHFGVSGPLVLSASAHLKDYKESGYYISIDLKPALDEKKLDARILRDFSKFANKDAANAISELVPHSMIPVILDLSEISPLTKTNSITKVQRRNLLSLLKDFRVNIKGPRPISEAVVTSGGINVKEIDPKTMESRIVRGLYFAGEIIDVDAYTGGYNLQIAWSTAYAAASAIIGGRNR